MSDRQYGIPSGYQEGSPPQNRGPISPIEQYNSMQSHQLQDYGPTQPARSLPRRPVGQSHRQVTGGSAYPGAPPPFQEDTSYSSMRSQSSTSPDRDPYGAGAVRGGLTGIATDIADSRPRESGMEAQRDIDNYYDNQRMMDQSPYDSYNGPRAPTHYGGNSQSSLSPLAAHSADIAGHQAAASRLQRNAIPGYGYGYDQSMPGGRIPYQGDGYDEFVDPNDIADDGDDLEAPPQQKQRRSRLGGALAGGAGAGTALKAFGSRDASGNYGPVPGTTGSGQEKSEWLKKQTGGNKKRVRWIVGIVVALIVIAVALGIVFGVVLKNGSGSPQRGSATDSGGLWDINSSQVQSVLNNNNLHKVFPGMDYTPLNAQYPGCLSNPPYQNDVTLDVAVLAQMTPAIRLYGTDCKQTEMVLKGIDLLGYNNTVKVWMGVWLSTNQTTNNRQLAQMYDILETYPADHFAGVIVGNEVLFRKDMTITQLASELASVKNRLSKMGINLPVSTSDLGNDWTAALAADSDIVMSNVHPFFAGVTPDIAPGWTWSFWQTHDVILKSGNSAGYPTNIISETGWPTQGGNDCGTGAKCATKTEGAVAGISELNQFMDGWVCQSMANGTTYFWFEAFDEPWKVIFNDPKTGDFWEPHWGLMDVNRNLKSGIIIPDCNGKTVDKPY